MAGLFYLKNLIWLNGVNSGFFSSHITNVATSMPILTSQSCADSLLTVCLTGQVGAIYRPPEHLWMPDRPVNEVYIIEDPKPHHQKIL